MPVDIYQHPKYSIHLLQNGNVQVNVLEGPQLMYSKRTNSDVILYADKDMHDQLLIIRSCQMPDAKSAFDVIDGQSTTKIGSLKKHVFDPNSIGEKWAILDKDDLPIAQIVESKPLIRKIIKLFIRVIPGAYDVSLSGAVLVKFSVVPLVNVWWLDFSRDTTQRLDRRLGISAGICMALGLGPRH